MPLLYLILSLALAENCPHEHEILGPYSFTKMNISDKVGCTISANASYNKSSGRRSLRFFKGGQISVFTEIEGGRGGANQTGGRFLYILPASDSMEMKKLGSFGMRVKDSSGVNWVFDPKGEVKTEEKCNLKVNKQVSWENEATDGNKDGGFLLKSCPNSIIIDSGFKRGGNAIYNKKGLTKIRDSKGTECSVANEELFNYHLERKETQAVIKPSKELYQILRNKSSCQSLDLTPLNQTTNRQRSSQQR